MIGVSIDKESGVINSAMTGIMSMIARIKQELKQTKSSGETDEITRLKMMYQSVKGARNAGTHGILAAPNVSGRQFNLWGAAAITTKGQEILAETLEFFEEKGIRVVYADTDGLYIGCSNSIYSLPSFIEALKLDKGQGEKNWLTTPDKALDAIEKSNLRWQKELNYPDFELEPEIHDSMVFVKHKNYLIFDVKHGSIEMITKGNNFK
jgi:DNA polymerase elongation subunit (family B)